MLAACLVPALLLSGCALLAEPLPTPCTDPPPAEDVIDVYFGCGCFWHVQYEFIKLEMTELCRSGEDLTARCAYAGSTNVGEGDLVCYHNVQHVADYGTLGHAEAVSISMPQASFGRFATHFWQICPGGARQDVADTGGEYRSVIGIPGGTDNAELMDILRQGAGDVALIGGTGGEGDTFGKRTVYVYDASEFPPHTAESYHQFHDDMTASYSSDYHALRQYASPTDCPGDHTFLQ